MTNMKKLTLEQHLNRCDWIRRNAGKFMYGEVEKYHRLKQDDTTLLYVGRVLGSGEQVIGVGRNYPITYRHNKFSVNVSLINENDDFLMFLSSMILCLAPNFEKTRLFPYVGDIDVQDSHYPNGGITIVPFPKLREKIQTLIEPNSELDKYTKKRNKTSFSRKEAKKLLP